MTTKIRFAAGQSRRMPALRDPEAVFRQGQNFGDRLADRVAAIGGSWRFIIAFSFVLVAWGLLNTLVLGPRAFDPFPFIFLNLMLSMVAALQAPIIMMSQNRQAAKDRVEARLDYETNMRSEVQIGLLQEQIAELRSLLLTTRAVERVD